MPLGVLLPVYSEILKGKECEFLYCIPLYLFPKSIQCLLYESLSKMCAELMYKCIFHFVRLKYRKDYVSTSRLKKKQNKLLIVSY